MDERLLQPRAQIRAELASQIAKGHEFVATEVADELELVALRKRISVWTDYNRQYLDMVISSDRLRKLYDRAARGMTIALSATLSQKIDKAREFVRKDVEALEELSERVEFIPEPGQDPEPPEERIVEEASIHVIGSLGDDVLEALEKLGLSGAAISEPTVEDIRESPAKFMVVLTSTTPESTARAACAFGKLGPQRICILKHEHTELPAGLQGTPKDEAGAWKLQLVKALKAAGFDVTADDLL